MFKAWVGAKFGVADNFVSGRRVLVLGESHHADEHPVGSVVPEMTHDTMRLYASGTRERWRRTFDNLAWAVSGKNRQHLERDGKRSEPEVWDSLAFYNYIPVVLAPRPRSYRPTSALFGGERTISAFEQVLAETKPEIVLIWGYELFPWVIRNHYADYEGHPWSFSGEWIDLPRNPPIRAVRMKHPSTGFSAAAWHGVVRRALDQEWP
ncbi:hypothetical protein [Mesorhizobium ventifaucium]|uniref:Uracil-DNA glycosylase-like domain-containing protein n=1 Tax=Mesorhizobium ventifaucium TaxID=666020 RepID=A0ABM9DD18_9HYPH|nr:hypothetical protein [Mesorhizobium ventifaucium]CAH2394144.1 conserved hypothetical protein [Mesorhizobium ventifaucium]